MAEKTRYELLTEAKERASKASSLLDEFTNIHKKMLKEFPPYTFGMTNRQAEKERGIDKTIERLSNIIAVPNKLASRFMDEDRRKEEKAALEAKKQLELDEIKKQETLKQEALMWLADNYPYEKIGVDFDLAGIVEYANGLAFEAAIQSERAEHQYCEFLGNDYCENCDGWDGISKRCQCGHRRVSWERDGDFSFKNPIIFAMAY